MTENMAKYFLFGLMTTSEYSAVALSNGIYIYFYQLQEIIMEPMLIKLMSVKFLVIFWQKCIYITDIVLIYMQHLLYKTF